MKRTFSFFLKSVYIILFANNVLSQVDKRDFPVIVHQLNPKVVSVFTKFRSDDVKPLGPFKVLDQVYFKILPQRHTQIKEGVMGYYFGFFSDESCNNPYNAKSTPRHGINALSVDAFHFRNTDNSGPNEIGEKNLNAPGEFRVLRYEGFFAEIRVLEFEIINAVAGELPSFASLSCVVTIHDERLK